MEKILVSQCLLGAKVRYDGKDNFCDHPLFKKWQDEGRVVTICPEVAGGMGIPRPKAAIRGKNGGEGVLQGEAKVLNCDNEDVTESFVHGANITLKLARKYRVKVAILKQGSPSCGSLSIYDGPSSKVKIPGHGVTAALLMEKGIKVFDENQAEAVDEYLKSLG